MRAILHIIIFGLFIQNISGQTITVSGKILHEFDYYIPDSRIDNITIDSTYYSDLGGIFKFKCLKGDSIRFSAIGTQDSLICFYSDTIVEIVLLHDGFSHSDGYLIRISMFKYFSIALDSRIIQIDNRNDIFMGISLTKPMSRGAGWYDYLF